MELIVEQGVLHMKIRSTDLLVHNGQHFELNKTGVLVWESLESTADEKGRTSVAETVSHLAKAFDSSPVEEIERDCTRFIRELSSLGLVAVEED